jgi:NAD(P)-dependent dehydrogenase (short-subunit alcohol dehydrogenase family)
MQLENTVIALTGGAQGIGEATARLCAGRGAAVWIADVKAEAGEAVAADIRAAGGAATFTPVDVRAEDQVRAWLAAIGRRHGRLDGLVCAAGLLQGAFVPPEAFETAVFDRVLDVNTRGSFLCAREATPLLVASGRGVMVLIASGAGVAGGSSSVAYGASKGGVNGLGMTLAHHLAPRGVRVNVVCPGEIVTAMKLSVVAADAERKGESPEAALAEARRTMGAPDGVARVIAFLLSPDADYIRGTLFTR